MSEVVGLMLPGWGLRERQRMTQKRAAALRNQLTQLVREVLIFGRGKPQPKEGLEQVAPQIVELLREYVPWVQRVTELPAEDFETDIYPDQLDQFADRYGALRARAVKRLKLQGRRTRTVPPESFQEATEPGFLDQFIKTPGAMMTALGVGAVLLLLVLWGRE